MIDELQEWLKGREPTLLIVLGSGLGGLAESVDEATVVPFADIGLPDTTVPGHAGRFVAGLLNGVDVLLQQGRLHLYEGVPVDAVVAAVRAAAGLGVRGLVVTNAAGGVNPSFVPGDLMVITDHLNLSGHNPLTGLRPPRFVDLLDAYTPVLRDALLEVAARQGVNVRTGVYAGLTGPSYETPAEIHMLRTLGADAVGMSTVNEVIAARAAGLAVAGVSLVTNVHRQGGTATDHGEVLAAAAEGGPRLVDLLWHGLPALAEALP